VLGRFGAASSSARNDDADDGDNDDDRMSCDSMSLKSKSRSLALPSRSELEAPSGDESDGSVNSMLSLCDDGDDEKYLEFGSLDGLQLGPDLDGPLDHALRGGDDADADVVEDDEVELHFFGDAEGGRSSGDEDFDGVDDGALSLGGGAVITLEALLSMHMTKGRILIEMRSLQQAEELFSFVIGEIEALIRYHRLVNPRHVEREEQFESAQREFARFRGAPPGHGQLGRSRRRRRRDFSATMPPPAARMAPPDTPFHRLTKSIGLENYYAARGDIYFKFKKLDEALCDFSNAIRYGQSKKEMGIYYNLRGVCYHEMKDYENAIADYDNAVQSTYGNHVAWNNRAALLVEMRDFDAAIDAANEAIRMDPSYGNAYKHRGVAYHLKGEFEAAITDINRCIKLLPDYGPGHLALQSIWNNVFDCVSVVSRQGVPLELIQIVVDYTVGSGCRDDEDMVHSTKR